MSGKPGRHVLYRIFSKRGVLLYVGITLTIVERMRAHRGTKDWWAEVARIDLEHHKSRAAVLAAESRAIKAERPRHNVKLIAKPPPVRVRPLSVQVNFGVDEDLRKQAIAIARVRGERDAIGKGASVIVRRALARYVKQHEHQLPENWRELL